MAAAGTPPWQQRVTFAYIDEPPFARPAAGGRAVGCDVELALTVLQAIGVQRVDLHLTTFVELLPGVAGGRWTLSTPLFVTAQRATRVAFSRPVWALGDGLIVRTGAAPRFDSYRSVAQAARARLGVVSGQVQRDAAVRGGVPMDRITEFETQLAALEALLAGTIDAYASTAVGNRTLVRELGHRDLAAIELPHEGQVPMGAFSFAHAQTELRDRFDQQLKTYLGSPAHRDLMAAHGLGASEIDPVVHQRRDSS